MIKNFITLAFRNLLKRKVYSFINIFGLAIGVAVCLVILKYVDFELSYDRFHKNAASTFRITSTYFQNGEERGTGIMTGYALGPALANDIPEVKTYIRTHPMYGGAVVSYKRDAGDPSVFRETEMQFADSTFFDVFTFQSIAGNLSTSLDNPNSVVITKKVVEKYFKKDEDPLGKILQVSGGWADGDYEITAVLENIPPNSHFVTDFIFPTHNLIDAGQYTQDDGWGWNNFVTYVQLHDNTTTKSADEKIPAFVEKYRGKQLAESNGKIVFNFQPIVDIHLTPGLGLESSATMSVNTIYFFLLISAFILAIAWINYINLSTARAMERAREVGIKKAIGAFRSQLITQFFFESILVNLIGVVLAVLLAVLLLPILGEIVNKELSFDFSDYRLWAVLGILFALGSFVSGGYPALVLSSFKTINVLKGKAENTKGGFSLRKALVVFQFASSLILIAGTFAIYRQVLYMKSQDKGLTMDRMLVVDGPKVMEWSNRQQTRSRLMSFKEEVKALPGVENVTSSGAIPGGGYNWGTIIRREGAEREDAKSGSIVWVDPDFVSTYGLTVISGKNFDISLASEMNGVLVNEAALTAYGLGDAEHALEERLILGGDTSIIIGVLKNYHWNSLKTEHSPWLLKADTIAASKFSVHLDGKNMPETIAKVEASFKNLFPGNPFDYYFLDDFFDKQYRDEQQFEKIFRLFAILAIVIACLGLWGLASFTTALKLKEIGIRKVLGATPGSIMSLLSWQFFKLVIIASVIAIPVTWYGIDKWLDNFAFRIGVQVDMFVVPFIILSILAIGTVSFQIFKGASINPAKTLRSE